MDNPVDQGKPSKIPIPIRDQSLKKVKTRTTCDVSDDNEDDLDETRGRLPCSMIPIATARKNIFCPYMENFKYTPNDAQETPVQSTENSSLRLHQRSFTGQAQKRSRLPRLARAPSSDRQKLTPENNEIVHEPKSDNEYYVCEGADSKDGRYAHDFQGNNLDDEPIEGLEFQNHNDSTEITVELGVDVNSENSAHFHDSTDHTDNSEMFKIKAYITDQTNNVNDLKGQREMFLEEPLITREHPTDIPQISEAVKLQVHNAECDDITTTSTHQMSRTRHLPKIPMPKERYQIPVRLTRKKVISDLKHGARDAESGNLNNLVVDSIDTYGRSVGDNGKEYLRNDNKDSEPSETGELKKQANEIDTVYSDDGQTTDGNDSGNALIETNHSSYQLGPFSIKEVSFTSTQILTLPQIGKTPDADQEYPEKSVIESLHDKKSAKEPRVSTTFRKHYNVSGKSACAIDVSAFSTTNHNKNDVPEGRNESDGFPNVPQRDVDLQDSLENVSESMCKTNESQACRYVLPEQTVDGNDLLNRSDTEDDVQTEVDKNSREHSCNAMLADNLTDESNYPNGEEGIILFRESGNSRTPRTQEPMQKTAASDKLDSDILRTVFEISKHEMSKPNKLPILTSPKDTHAVFGQSALLMKPIATGGERICENKRNHGAPDGVDEDQRDHNAPDNVDKDQRDHDAPDNVDKDQRDHGAPDNVDKDQRDHDAPVDVDKDQRECRHQYSETNKETHTLEKIMTNLSQSSSVQGATSSCSSEFFDRVLANNEEEKKDGGEDGHDSKELDDNRTSAIRTDMYKVAIGFALGVIGVVTWLRYK